MQQATQLCKVTDVRREVVAGALNQLQAAISQGASPSQQSLLTLFRFAEAVFSCSSCPWPHAKQEFEVLSKVYESTDTSGSTLTMGKLLACLAGNCMCRV